ncbi:MAG: hypothetical protein Q9218_002640 [Villophora microphyllina]
MRFGRSLQNSIYEPWRSKYIDYAKLKRLLREEDSPIGRDGAKSKDEASGWTEEDEGVFVDELVNVQLEKVNAFHDETYKSIRDRTSDCESKLQEIAGPEKNEASKDLPEAGMAGADRNPDLSDMLHKLDGITKEINELEKYSRINYTGFLKAAKKHDRRLKGKEEQESPEPEGKQQAAQYKSYKFWVHPENLLEVKTYILRRLPVLVYNPRASKVAEGGQQDPRITSLYFDNAGFSLYTGKVGKDSGASSLRLRWFGHLNDKPEIFLEKKTMEEGGNSDEIRFSIKAKYINDFLSGRYKMEKSLNKLEERQGSESSSFIQLRSNADAIQTFIKENKLQPMLRANYTRTAFQIPGDDRVRISLDTDLTFLREDSLDPERPCRDPSDWHCTDIDANEMDFPFPGTRRGEISRFPYALLEVKVREGAKKKTNTWVSDLMLSHLIKNAPRFSKFVHGIAQLFEDHVNSFPFWLSDLETDIRRDPETAFHEEQEKKAKHAAEEQAVGSFMGSHSNQAFAAAVGSPITKLLGVKNNTPGGNNGDRVAQGLDSDEDGEMAQSSTAPKPQGLQSFLPSFSGSKYGRSRQREITRLPPGVRDPGRLIKDTGPVRVEPKVWLANQRTFIKWQHISVLLATLSLSLYNAAGEDNGMAQSLAIAYTLIAAAVAGWGWWVYTIRSQMIRERSGKDFDNVSGPIVVCLALIVALCLNFGLKVGHPASITANIVDSQQHRAFHEQHQAILRNEQERHQRLTMNSSHEGRTGMNDPMASNDSGSHSIGSIPSTISPTTSLSGTTSWPPRGLSDQSLLSFNEAVVFIAEGAICFEAKFIIANHGKQGDIHILPLIGLINGPLILEATAPSAILADCMSFPRNGAAYSQEPWITLEQPSMVLCFGRFPGTMTLNRYMGTLNYQTAPVDSPPMAMLREVNFYQIIDRLRYLQDVIDIPFQMTEQEQYFLHDQLITDATPDSTRCRLENDINALSSLLDNQIWTDFGDIQNQVVADHFVAETDDTPLDLFFHQILLSAELDRRIRLYSTIAGKRTDYYMTEFPRKVAWSANLSRMLLQKVDFEGHGFAMASSTRIMSRLLHDKIRQLAKISDIGHALHWPRMDEVKSLVKKESRDRAVHFGWSAPSLTFLLGVTLPGPSATFMAMNCLVDCSPVYREDLVGLREMRPQSGFQYLIHTYWHWESIVGKVLGAMQDSSCVAGWIGPCAFTPDLDRVQYVRIYSKRTVERMKNRDRSALAVRSDPLGFQDVIYRVSDFALVLPDIKKTIANITMEKLAVQIHVYPSTGEPGDLLEHDVAVQFAVGGVSWAVRLRYNVSFVAAAACWSGPHVLWREYKYKAVSVRELISNSEWAGWNGATDSSTGNPNEEDDDTVLLIEAYGAADNAVFARAW